MSVCLFFFFVFICFYSWQCSVILEHRSDYCHVNNAFISLSLVSYAYFLGLVMMELPSRYFQHVWSAHLLITAPIQAQLHLNGSSSTLFTVSATFASKTLSGCLSCLKMSNYLAWLLPHWRFMFTCQFHVRLSP